jgi:hypothetical protein
MERFGQVTLRRVDPDILVESLDGKILFLIPVKYAQDIGAGIIYQAHQVETYEVAEDLTYQQAMLRRLGIPLGLTDDQVIQQESLKEAAWSSDLRRYIQSKHSPITRKLWAPKVSKESPQ